MFSEWLMLFRLFVCVICDSSVFVMLVISMMLIMINVKVIIYCVSVLFG